MRARKEFSQGWQPLGYPSRLPAVPTGSGSGGEGPGALAAMVSLGGTRAEARAGARPHQLFPPHPGQGREASGSRTANLSDHHRGVSLPGLWGHGRRRGEAGPGAGTGEPPGSKEQLRKVSGASA